MKRWQSNANGNKTFFLKDHLESVRAVVSETGEVIQTNDYYPYGDLFEEMAADLEGSDNRFLFTGKELCTETGLHDFSARFMQSRFGRFTTIDPLAEKYPGICPYAYCNGNPVNFVDQDGMDWYAYYLGRQDSYENMLPYNRPCHETHLPAYCCVSWLES